MLAAAAQRRTRACVGDQIHAVAAVREQHQVRREGACIAGQARTRLRLEGHPVRRDRADDPDAALRQVHAQAPAAQKDDARRHDVAARYPQAVAGFRLPGQSVAADRAADRVLLVLRSGAALVVHAQPTAAVRRRSDLAGDDPEVPGAAVGGRQAHPRLRVPGQPVGRARAEDAGGRVAVVVGAGGVAGTRQDLGVVEPVGPVRQPHDARADRTAQAGARRRARPARVRFRAQVAVGRRVDGRIGQLAPHRAGIALGPLDVRHRFRGTGQVDHGSAPIREWFGRW